MSKNLKIGVVIIIIILIAGVIGGWIYYKSQIELNDNSIAKNEDATVLNPINGQVVGDKIAETNPFAVKINPYDSYKNPFKQ